MGHSCCCLKLQSVALLLNQLKKCGNWIEKRKYWQKGTIYVILAVIPIIPYRNMTIILGCAPVFATGTFYGLMSLGKKANRSEMVTNSQSNSGSKYQPFHNEP